MTMHEAGGHSPAQMERPIPDSYWVDGGRLLAGEYPGAKQETAARHKLRRLLAAGASVFVDLTEEGEGHLLPYASLLYEEATALGLAADHRRMPIPDLGVPAPAFMVQILDLLDSLLHDNRLPYVHCWGGIGRTGTVVGCYLVRHGMSGEGALAYIARQRRGTPDGYVVSPETDTQRAMVQTWSKGR
jgi:hypothetical protein